MLIEKYCKDCVSLGRKKLGIRRILTIKHKLEAG